MVCSPVSITVCQLVCTYDARPSSCVFCATDVLPPAATPPAHGNRRACTCVDCLASAVCAAVILIIALHRARSWEADVG
jgi:hypothetical protein